MPAEDASGNNIERTVLIVDDEQPIREIVENGLGHLGYQTMSAASGAAGFGLIQQGQ